MAEKHWALHPNWAAVNAETCYELPHLPFAPVLVPQNLWRDDFNPTSFSERFLTRCYKGGGTLTQTADFVVTPQNNTPQENSSQWGDYQTCSWHTVMPWVETEFMLLSIRLPLLI